MTLADNTYNLPTVVNLRDLGGLPTANGSTAAGVLLRSDAPYRGDLAPEGFDWPPAAVLDLRDVTEGADAIYDWPTGVEVINYPIFTGARLDRSVLRPLVDIYQQVLDTAAPRVVGAINNFSETGSTVVHCAAGKDRTGIVVAVSLLLAGVDTDAIIADYQRTEDAIGNVFLRMQERNRLFADVTPENQIFRTPRPAIDLVLETVDGGTDGVWGWFEQHGGDLERLERWRNRFVG